MSETNKSMLTKILAILGFCVTVALIIWLIISVVSRAPGAFSSLSDMADSIDLRTELNALEVVPEKSIVNSDEPFEISWTDTKLAGTYGIGHECAEGMTIFFRNPEGTLRPMRCGPDLLSLPAEVTKLAVVARSTQDRFTDVTFRVLFSESTSTPPIEGTAKVTVVNATIPAGGATSTATTTPSENDIDTPTEAPSEPVETDSAPTPVPQTVTTYVYPQSDPQGHTDLAITIKSENAHGAYGQSTVTFMVKNIGTKTSGSWSFTADLPNNEDYTSTQYAGLKPQEYMTFTMSFPLSEYSFGESRATYRVFAAGDTNQSNNTAQTAGY